MNDVFLDPNAPKGKITGFAYIFWIGILPWIGFTHLIYPFRKVRRNRTILFFTILIPIGILCSFLLTWMLWIMNSILFGGM